uniref:Ig-like domain-containing protein n=1 Tax=Astyanax mexicanus TaxID=7994 RepID=A0A3B1JQS6_ASTMX
TCCHLCVLLPALAVRDSPPNPPVLTPTKGETTTMHCNLGTIEGAAWWYKQVPGGVPQHVLKNYHDWSSPEFGSGFSSPKFRSTCSTKSDCNLIISNVEVGDSAVYYCKTLDGSVSVEFVSQ